MSWKEQSVAKWLLILLAAIPILLWLGSELLICFRLKRRMRKSLRMWCHAHDQFIDRAKGGIFHTELAEYSLFLRAQTNILLYSLSACRTWPYRLWAGYLPLRYLLKTMPFDADTVGVAAVVGVIKTGCRKVV